VRSTAQNTWRVCSVRRLHISQTRFEVKPRHLSVAMPQIVASSSMDAESITIVREYVNELMAYVLNSCLILLLLIPFRWMVKERDRIFLNEYDHASQQYQNIART
jgi:hypothetical protein